PDHVIFLGPALRLLPTGAGAAGETAPLLLVPGIGALRRRDVSPAVAALARCLADVTGRIAGDRPIRVLSAAEEAELLGWDAEKLRQAVR
ncbi:MAG TPA: class II aldolase, partial [Crenalkalicoccus sp.]|nr:class II aldolase [Crenalkalicoccus sp.]